MAKQDWQYEYFRCIYCNHKGEWVTTYVRGQSFSMVFEYLRDKSEMWIIKEISSRLESRELMGKLIEGEDLNDPVILYPENKTKKAKQ